MDAKGSATYRQYQGFKKTGYIPETVILSPGDKPLDSWVGALSASELLSRYQKAKSR